MNEKKVVIAILAGVALFWIIVIVANLLLNRNPKQEADGKGGVIIQEHVEVDDNNADLYDMGYVLIQDDEELLSSDDFITLKGHVYLPELLTLFIRENGYDSVSYVIMVPSSKTTDRMYSIFDLQIPDTNKAVHVVFDKIVEEFQFTMKDM